MVQHERTEALEGLSADIDPGHPPAIGGLENASIVASATTARTHRYLS